MVVITNNMTVIFSVVLPLQFLGLFVDVHAIVGNTPLVNSFALGGFDIVSVVLRIVVSCRVFTDGLIVYTLSRFLDSATVLIIKLYKITSMTTILTTATASKVWKMPAAVSSCVLLEYLQTWPTTVVFVSIFTSTLSASRITRSRAERTQRMQ